jgi:hypothetical protein
LARSFKVENILWRNNPTDNQDYLWVLPINVPTASFVLDLLQVQTLSGVNIRNSHNAKYQDRGVKGFTIEVRTLQILSM